MQTNQSRVVRILAVLLFGLGLCGGAMAQSEQVVYSLGVVPKDGACPMAGLVFDRKGNLYGTTSLGHGHGLFQYGSGTVFQLTHSARGWKENVLYTFTGKDGAVPAAGLVIDQNGVLYGTTSRGGTNDAGVVFKVFHNSTGWHEQVLYSFTGLTDGGSPFAGVILDAAGNLYGTTELGGDNARGTIYQLTHGPNGWTEKVLHSFGPAARFPFGGLVFDTAGNLYGTTRGGGTATAGTVFRLSPGMPGRWKFAILYNFLGTANGNSDGQFPYGTLILDGQGNLYGTTKGGGAFNGGIVFQLKPAADGTWTERILKYGAAGHGGGKQFMSGLTFDAAGRLYGTASGGGALKWGVVYNLTPTVTGLWQGHVVYTFTGLNDGGTPLGGVVLDAQGNIFGTTFTGGDAGNGTIFEIVQ